MKYTTDVFLSHNWGKDEKGRDNHYRVSLINHKLNELGYRTWFDDHKIKGDIDDEISKGIEQTKCVIIFMTQWYHDKVNTDIPHDKCRLEFNHAKRTKTANKMVAIVMEPSMIVARKWKGQVGMYFGGKKYINMSGDLSNKIYLETQIKKLQELLQPMGVRPGIFSSF